MSKIRFLKKLTRSVNLIVLLGRENVRRRTLSLSLALFLSSSLLFAQGWPVPAKTPNTEVACNPCPGFSRTDLKTVGYQSPISTFVGRFIDSQNTGTFQQPFRTARGEMILVAPDRNRVYMLIGSAL